MRLRPLGNTGLDLSELTFGTSALDPCYGADRAEAASALALAFELGINAVESGSAGSQALLGELLRNNGARNRIHMLARIPSLVPFDLPSPHISAQQAYPGAHIRAEVEAMLQRLGVEQIAAVFLPDWCAEWMDEGDWAETLIQLRAEGKVAAFGVSLFDHDVDAGERIVASGAIQCISAMYNVFDPGAAARLFLLCLKHQVGVIARSPLYFGGLAPAIHQAEPFSDWRRAYFFDEHLAETRSRVAALQAAGFAMPETAIRFALSHPAISTVAVGMRTATQVQANAAAAANGAMSSDELSQLSRHKWLC